MAQKELLRVAIIGTGSRAAYMYQPILRGLADEMQLVAVWGRREESAARLGKEFGVPWFVDMERLVREAAPQIGIVVVNYHANGEVGLMAVEAGLHILAETPIAHRLDEADAIIRAAAERGLKIEVAEQFHRRPMEQIKLKLIQSGLFGNVYSSFNDFAGHGYHGVSVMRSYLGFDAKPVQVIGSEQKYALAPHWARLEATTGPRTETQEHGIVGFENGQVGIFHWSDVSYDSPLRWWRSSRFLAERGMGISVGRGFETEEWLSLLSEKDLEAPHFITLERRYDRVDGGMLQAVIAHTCDSQLPLVRWDNPFRTESRPHGPQWHDDEIGVAGCLMSLVQAVRENTEPSYGAAQARLDQEIILAIRESARTGGNSVILPLDPAAQSD